MDVSQELLVKVLRSEVYISNQSNMTKVNVYYIHFISRILLPGMVLNATNGNILNGNENKRTNLGYLQ